MKITKSQYPKLVALMQSAYPDYTGKKFFIEVANYPINATSFWDEGSRMYFKFVRSDNKTLVPLEQAPWFQTEENRKVQLQPGLACITRAIFCGHECGLTIHLHPTDMPKQLEN